MKGIHRWFDRRQKKEEFSRLNPFVPFDKFELPAVRDVLFAKGKPYRSHQGNVDFLVVINSFVFDYEAANRRERRALILKVIRTVHENGAEFLTLGEDGWWVKVGEKLLIDKVSKAFANATRKRASYAAPGEGGTLSSKGPPFRVVHTSDHDLSLSDQEDGCFGCMVVPGREHRELLKLKRF
jgi:hypothetical protein